MELWPQINYLQNYLPFGSELYLLWNGTHVLGDHEDQDFSLLLGSKTFENKGNPSLWTHI